MQPQAPLSTAAIGFHRDDGDFQLLATLNNNDELIAPHRFTDIAHSLRDDLQQALSNQAEPTLVVLDRQDSPDYVTLDDDELPHKHVSGTPDIDAQVHAILSQHCKIAVIWCIDDVRHLRPDLTEDRAWQVLQQVSDIHDAEWAISWTTLRTVADDLFPEPDDADEASASAPLP
ncbi:MAG TPA: hypothetical protein VFA18_02480 [Gemmataceae bacterium]|nr:hypothetical protein [Gemmataceae bacterium]